MNMRLTTLLTSIAITLGFAFAQTLTVWGPEDLADPSVADLWNELKADFEEDHPGVTVKYMNPTGTINDGAVQAAIRSNAGPDVLLTNSGIGRVDIVSDAGLVEPLTEYYESRGWSDRLYPWLVEELKAQRDGAIYEVPNGLDAIGLFYHRDVMEQHGWESPETWDEMMALFEEIQNADLIPFIVGPRSNFNGGHLFGGVIQATAGREVMADIIYGDGRWDQPAMIESARNLQKLVHEGYIPEEAVSLTFDDAMRLWFNKRAVFSVAGPWFTNNARAAEFDMSNVGYMPFPPVDPEQEPMPTGGIGWSWMIPNNSKQPELALEWIDFIFSEEGMMKRAQHSTSWMVFPKELPPYEPSTPVLNEVFAAASGGVGFNPSVYIPGSVVDPYYQVIQGLIGDLVTPEQGMKMIQQEWERAKAQ
jgi:raffinose/stachyose/melibiose transport system substrate-binding protein